MSAGVDSRVLLCVSLLLLLLQRAWTALEDSTHQFAASGKKWIVASKTSSSDTFMLVYPNLLFRSLEEGEGDFCGSLHSLLPLPQILQVVHGAL